MLKGIEPAKFVDAWLSAPKENNGWYRIGIALEHRYEGPALNPLGGYESHSLKSETTWIKSMMAELKKRASEAKGFMKYRIERAIPRIDVPDDELMN